MSVIEKIARAICKTQLRMNGEKTEIAYKVDNEWSYFIPEAKVALQCLSDNIDEGGLEAAYDICGVDAGKQNFGAREYVKDAIATYLNTISKE